MVNYPACYIYSFADIINFSRQLVSKPVHPRSIRRFLSAGSPSMKNPHCNTSSIVSIKITQMYADNLTFLPVGTAFDLTSEHLRRCRAHCLSMFRANSIGNLIFL